MARQFLITDGDHISVRNLADLKQNDEIEVVKKPATARPVRVRQTERACGR
jgi:hypothetical protein